MCSMQIVSVDRYDGCEWPEHGTQSEGFTQADRGGITIQGSIE